VAERAVAYLRTVVAASMRVVVVILHLAVDATVVVIARGPMEGCMVVGQWWCWCSREGVPIIGRSRKLRGGRVVVSEGPAFGGVYCGAHGDCSGHRC